MPNRRPREAGLAKVLKMRLIDTHKGSDANDAINLSAVDETGPGNANHKYRAEWDTGDGYMGAQGIDLQKGAIKEVGRNGITDEVLLAIVVDRLRGFQAGQFSCRENALAITNIEQGLHWMNARTKDRMSRGVEGVSKA
jgi:hypothetical protein